MKGIKRTTLQIRYTGINVLDVVDAHVGSPRRKRLTPSLGFVPGKPSITPLLAHPESDEFSLQY
jgi:hypothetical protein